MGADRNVTPPVGSGNQVSWRRQGWELLQGIGTLCGTLVLVPLVVILFGSYWQWDRFVLPARAMLIESGGDSDEDATSREVHLHFYDDGGDPGRGVSLPQGSHLDIELPRAVERFRIIIQVDFNDVYEMSASPDGSEFTPLWEVPRGRGGSYLTTRPSSWLETERPSRFLRVRAFRGRWCMNRRRSPG